MSDTAVIIVLVMIGAFVLIGALAMAWPIARDMWEFRRRIDAQPEKVCVRAGEFHEDDDVVIGPGEHVRTSHFYSCRVLLHAGVKVFDCTFIGCVISMVVDPKTRRATQQLAWTRLEHSTIIPVDPPSNTITVRFTGSK